MGSSASPPALEIDLVRATDLVGGSAAYPISQATAVWRAARDTELPDATSIFVASLRMPDAPFLPEAVRGRSWFEVQALVLDGDRDALDSVLAAGARERSQIGTLDVSQIPSITNDPREAGAAVVLSALLRELPDEAIDAVLRWHGSETGAAAVSVGGRLLGGALDHQRRPSVATTRGAGWLVSAILPFPEGGDPIAQKEAAAELLEVLRPWTVPGTIPTFLGLDDRLDAALAADDIELVRTVRERLGAGVIRPTRL